MRAKIIIPVLILAVMIVGLAVFFRKSDQTPTASPIASAQNSGIPAATASMPVSPRVAHTTPNFGITHPPQLSAALEGEPADENSAEHIAFVQKKIDALDDLARSGDAANLPLIVNELGNPEQKIRAAAIRAAVDLGNRDAIPALQNQWAQTDDPQEKLDIQHAIDFLRLPSAMAQASASSIQ